jgi:RimJ/RimL family protein N-acetyltransferase
MATTAPLEVKTARLRLRQLRAGDIVAFAGMNADREVMRYFPRCWTRPESESALTRVVEGFQARGFGLYAVEVAEGGEFAGIVGLSVPTFKASFTPCVEILWRLPRLHWGKGYATEAATAVLNVAFTQLQLDEVVAFTTRDNLRSMRVMERIGMSRDIDGDFDHPRVEAPALRPHVLYRITRSEWAAKGAGN